MLVEAALRAFVSNGGELSIQALNLLEVVHAGVFLRPDSEQKLIELVIALLEPLDAVVLSLHLVANGLHLRLELGGLLHEFLIGLSFERKEFLFLEQPEVELLDDVLIFGVVLALKLREVAQLFEQGLVLLLQFLDFEILFGHQLHFQVVNPLSQLDVLLGADLNG